MQKIRESTSQKKNLEKSAKQSANSLLLFVLKSKINIFEKISNGETKARSHEKILKKLILSFELIVQPSKHTFEIALFFEFRVLS